MAAVGLLYVGAVLFVNGLMLLGYITPRGAAPLNLFVGFLQVLTPTYLVIFAAGDMSQIVLAAGLYFFGFTYLWVGINAITGWTNHGLGWFSLVVTLSALGFASHSWVELDDHVFAVLWSMWAVLWFTFFILMALDRSHLAPAVGVLAIGNALLSTGLPGFLILTGWWPDSMTLAVTIAVLGLLLLALCLPVGRLFTARETSPDTGPASTPVT
ncbi:AmiS/UreI family transporter [Nesterenkonia sphaerica]|uniref:Transporter n=1 Tax=Nesterenkonia sphaerica TaxID=1804988 RepID=A0A5R9A3W8_9MICC|nr:AmiS/UreI family transporter [Nesterenkonia sphaerica]TLP72884.1 transporter [Nesterenkonia sphaerica]